MKNFKGPAAACRGLFLALVLAAVPSLQAGGPPPGVPSGAMPWEWGKYLGYREPHGSSPKPVQPTLVTKSPAKYTLRVTLIPHKHTYDDPTAVFLVAHLPEDADFWVEGKPTTQRGSMRTFVSPSLQPGVNYRYTVRAVWFEEGQWVSQDHNFPIHAGEVHCIDLVQSSDRTTDETVTANFGKLKLEDRKEAEAQRYCAIQNGVRLGAMGVPVKVTIKSQPVFLCCAGCLQKAQTNPEQTLRTVQETKAKSTGSSPP